MELQVSGLKSITSKHLALASQVISFTYAIIPGRWWQINILLLPQILRVFFNVVADAMSVSYFICKLLNEIVCVRLLGQCYFALLLTMFGCLFDFTYLSCTSLFWIFLYTKLSEAPMSIEVSVGGNFQNELDNM